MEAWTHAASQASPLAVQNAALRMGFVLPYGMAAWLLVATPLGLFASSRSRRASKQRCRASMLLGVLASKQLASVACGWAVRIPCRGPERKSVGGSGTRGKLDAMRYSGRVTGKESRGLDQRCSRADNALMPPGVCAVQPRGVARKQGKSMKAPHKSILAHAAKDARRYSIQGAWLAKIPTMDGSSRWAWCATDGRTAAVAYLDDNDAKEAEEANSGHGRKNGLSSTVFPLEVLERKGAFRLIPEGLRIASVAFADGASFRLMDVTPPMLDSIVRDEIRVGDENRIDVYLYADNLIRSLEAAVVGARAKRGRKDGSDLMVKLSFRTTDGAHASRDAINCTAPFLVTPAHPEHAGKALAVCMPCSLNAEENKAREKRLKAAVKAAQERDEEVLALRRRVADLTREVARLEGAAQTAQEVRP